MSPDAYQRARDAIATEPCRCVSCPDCRGTGYTWRQLVGVWPDEESQTCDYCWGSGFSDICDRCEALEDLGDSFA